MRILVAPDKFAGTLDAVEAAAAIADGWRRTAPDDDVRTIPVADGGPGFLEVLHATLGGSLSLTTVSGPLGEPTPATVLLVGDTAYLESAQACGLALLPHEPAPDGKRRPVPGAVDRATTYGVGELIGHAVDAGARRIVIGLGGSGTNDGGAGMIAALGGLATPEGALHDGFGSLAGLEAVDLAAARTRVDGVDLVAAADVENPLLGLRGASNIFGAQKGLVSDDVRLAADAALTRWADLVDRRTADHKGAGAAGGLGYGILVLGGRREPGFATVASAVGLAEEIAAADLVITGEGKLDWQSLGGKVISGVAELAGPALRPCIVLAGAVEVGNRELRANGIEAAYAMVDVVGVTESFGQPARSLSRVAERVAKTWSRR